MHILSELYRPSLSLLTDLYQLTMACGYWKNNLAEREAVFHMYFRKNPFKGGYTVCCGLEYAIDYLRNLHFSQQDLDYLSELRGHRNQPMFPDKFLEYLSSFRFRCDVAAIPEGTVVFPNEPLVRVQGPLLQAQLVETALLTILNFQTLIATKASRVSDAVQGDQLMEFGMRRAQGIDGALAASRAAYIGGADSTSNVLAGKLFDIPVKGTHAHSWVMAFEEETDAFSAYGKAFPHDSVFLVDTYNTLEGVKNAIAAAQQLKDFEFGGIRLDSGDLTYLSREARKLLDAAGFTKTAIVASNDLDEHIIESLKHEGAKINVWGVGTQLVTAFDQPALGGVYKMAALRNEHGKWENKIKLSEQLAKTSNPGVQQVRRFKTNDGLIADMIYDETAPLPETVTLVDPLDITKRKTIPAGTPFQDLLIPVFEAGKCVYEVPSLVAVKQKVKEEKKLLHESIRRFLNPHVYPVGLEESLHTYKTELILKFRGYPRT